DARRPRGRRAGAARRHEEGPRRHRLPTADRGADPRPRRGRRVPDRLPSGRGARRDRGPRRPVAAARVRRAPGHAAAPRGRAARSEATRPVTTYVDPATGERHGAMWLIPRTADDLEARRRVHRFWAEASYGLMGRTPDHVACVLTAFAGAQPFFARGGARFAD